MIEAAAETSSSMKRIALDLVVSNLDTEPDGAIMPSRLGNHLGMPIVTFFTLLRQEGILQRDGAKHGSGKNYPTEDALKNGLVRVEAREYKGEEIEQIFITRRGIEQIVSSFLENPTPPIRALAMALCLCQGWAQGQP